MAGRDEWIDGNETGFQAGYREGYDKGQAAAFEKMATESERFQTGHRMGYSEGWKAAMDHVRAFTRKPLISD